MPLTPGTILGQYEIRSPLGAGGMGEVYRAHDTRLNREVAIKVLPESLTSDPERLRRFEQEARAVAALNHPNILAVYQMGTHDGASYMVTELLEGETLRERLRRGPIPIRKAIDYAVQIAHGLAAAHDKGITHRDLKPENLFVTKDGRVKILDFGLAKLDTPKDAPEAAPTVTQGTEPGVVMGTVGYMSPEQVRGKTADHRSDIFAFGTILYEMVTGKQTFRKPTSPETMAAILNEDPPSISEIAPTAAPALQRVVHRCLEKNPEQRFQSASDMAFALEALSDSAITTASGGHGHLDEGARRRRIAMAGAALVVLLGVAVMAYLWLRPAPVPKVSNYVQLTHDGRPKNLVGTDGSRLYLYVMGRDYRGPAQMSISGGEATKTISPLPVVRPIDVSPDGSQFLVRGGKSASEEWQLWSQPVLGGAPRRLGDIEAQDASWSADGKLMAYCDDNNVFVARVDGSESRKILTLKDADLIYAPVWSPDGKRLRFDARYLSDALYSLWEVSVDGSNAHPLIAGWSNLPNEMSNGKWTADGRYFVFQSHRQIWALPRKGGLFHSEPKPIQLTSSPLWFVTPLPSKDGKKLFVVGRNVRGELTRYDVKSRQFMPFLGGISAEFAAYSKDGQWVAYVAYPEGTLWRSKADGSERLQLSYPPNQAVVPRWSPDGKTIIFFEVTAGKPPRIEEVSFEGGNPKPLMPDSSHHQRDPNWSPDGSKIVFDDSSVDAPLSIRILDLATRQVTTLPGSQGLWSPRWSPDGRHISALSSDHDGIELFDFQTEKWTELAKGFKPGFPNWSKDAQYLYVLDESGTWAVLKIRVSDRNTERLVELKDFESTGYWGYSLALAPDDSPLLLRNTGSWDVYSLDWEEP